MLSQSSDEYSNVWKNLKREREVYYNKHEFMNTRACVHQIDAQNLDTFFLTFSMFQLRTSKLH